MKAIPRGSPHAQFPNEFLIKLRLFLRSIPMQVAVLLASGTVSMAQGLSPQEAVRRMSVPADLQVSLVAAEPMIVQPVCIEFDNRGRLWVVQYVQYPNPEGLKRASVDRWSRTTYDHAPEPPPRGPKGADCITILDDENGDGVADKAHDFVKGLNLATGIAFGHGGVFVLNVPYLLFYPDRNQDDVPDSDPEVCLSGFGMEDAHSVANSLTWGADGWLYGCQGSTVTARIRGQEFQQGVWRYHPLTHEFELFCEGGGNSWGLDFDAEGELIYSTNAGPYRSLHGMQGAYLWKSFGKHGPLHNPYAFGWFDHIPHANSTGGHVAAGGIVYQGTHLPSRYQGRYLCADLLGHGVQWHEMKRRGSTFSSSYVDYLLRANDAWFAPCDLTVSPDGAVYVADWCDQRTAHPDPDAEWDRSNGRVYRIAAKGSSPKAAPALMDKKTEELIALLGDPNPWVVRTVRRLLADRRDPEAVLPLRAQILEAKDERLALQSLWALQVSGGYNESFAEKTLRHPLATVRKWSVRLLGDEKHVSLENARQLVELARSDDSVRVRGQLAATAKRIPSDAALPVLEALLLRDVDADDPYVPLQLWWALERHSISALPEIERFMISPMAWKSRLVREVIVTRLMRRWIAEGTTASYDAAGRLLASAPDEVQRQRLFAAMEQGFEDRPTGLAAPDGGGLFANSAKVQTLTTQSTRFEQNLPPSLLAQIDAAWRDDTQDAVLIALGLRSGRAAASERARQILEDSTADTQTRTRMIALLAKRADAADAPRLLRLVGSGPVPLQFSALDALPAFEKADLGGPLISRYSLLEKDVRARVRQVLLSRQSWARALLQEVDSGRVAASDFSNDELRVVALHGDAALDKQVAKHWGRMSAGTTEEKLAEMRRLKNDLNAGKGDAARGRELYARVCAACHTLHGEGGHIGPDLTQANRADREFLLLSLVDPSAAIRKEYLTSIVQTTDGRVLSGVNADDTGDGIVLGTITGERVTIPLAQVRSVQQSTVSLMPEGLMKLFKPQELRDLFSYLESKQPPARNP
jgi:putative membrane-bound dehydrogenase-like protein